MAKHGHALVIGGSMAGLAAARVLLDHFSRVSLVERDELSDAPQPRKGVPQGRHLHGLLKRGEELLAGLFPDLVPSLLAGGAVPVEFGSEFYWYHFGGWKVKAPSGVVATFLSRPFLEAEVRRRVKALPNLTLLDGHDVERLAGDRARVTGVVVKRRTGDAAEETLPADLVVDASGRGSHLPKWLEALGHARPLESTVKVNVAYATRIYRRPPEGTVPWKALYILGQSPDSKRLGAIAPMEGDRWIALVAGMLDDHPPTDEPGWLEFARNLPQPDVYEAVKGAEPLSDIALYKFPSHLRRHYEKMRDFPDGIVALGDSVCSFNPLYGQGMTTAAMGALHLGECLSQKADLAGLPRRFQAGLAKLTNDPWMMSTGEDFRYPEVAGERPFGNSIMQWYTGRVHRAALGDAQICNLFYRAMHMLDAPAVLMRPGTFVRVLRGS